MRLFRRLLLLGQHQRGVFTQLSRDQAQVRELRLRLRLEAHPIGRNLIHKPANRAAIIVHFHDSPSPLRFLYRNTSRAKNQYGSHSGFYAGTGYSCKSHEGCNLIDAISNRTGFPCNRAWYIIIWTLPFLFVLNTATPVRIYTHNHSMCFRMIPCIKKSALNVKKEKCI